MSHDYASLLRAAGLPEDARFEIRHGSELWRSGGSEWLGDTAESGSASLLLASLRAFRFHARLADAVYDLLERAGWLADQGTPETRAKDAGWIQDARALLREIEEDENHA